jgi:hypothetical protein
VGVLYYLFMNLASDFGSGVLDHTPHAPYPKEPFEYDYVPRAKSRLHLPSPPSQLLPPGNGDGGPAAAGGGVGGGTDDGKKPSLGAGTAAPVQRYNGPVKFHNLAVSLHAISGTRGTMFHNKNVLFAAASLKSAAVLLPLACAMGTEFRSYVHFALMSRSDVEMKELKKINGIDDECEIIFHGTAIQVQNQLVWVDG